MTMQNADEGATIFSLNNNNGVIFLVVANACLAWTRTQLDRVEKKIQSAPSLAHSGDNFTVNTFPQRLC